MQICSQRILTKDRFPSPDGMWVPISVGAWTRGMAASSWPIPRDQSTDPNTLSEGSEFN